MDSTTKSDIAARLSVVERQIESLAALVRQLRYDLQEEVDLPNDLC